MIILTKSGVYVKTTDLQSNKPEKYNPVHIIKKYFTIKTKTIGESYVQTAQYKMEKIKKDTYIRIPRFGLFALLSNAKICKKIGISSSNKITNKIEKGERPLVKFNWQGKFQGNQALVANHIIKNYYNKESIKQGKSGVIVKLGTGQGKTFLAMGLINKIQRKTLIITHSETVLYDWTKELTRLFPTSKIGWYYGKKKVDGDIQIAIIDSLLNDEFTFKKYSDNTTTISNSISNTKKASKPQFEYITLTQKEYFKQFGFIIFDESHEYCSKTRSKIFWKAQTRFMLGLSATPDERLDKFDPVAWWGIGPVLDAKTIPKYTEKHSPFTAKVHMVKYIGPPEYTKTILCEKTQIISTPLMLNNMIKDPHRMDLICKQAKKLYEQNLYTFIFADRCDYLMEIRQLLLDKYNISCDEPLVDNKKDSKKVVKITGGATSQEMKQAEDNAKIILTTYQYLSTGKSIQKMNAILLATPRKSKSVQTLGRIFRLGSNYDIERQIVDIVDWGTIFKNQWYKRKKIYDERKYPIEITKIKAPPMESQEALKSDNEDDEN